ncbi:hypothetical protein [Pantoea sp. Z09]|nr:hypothetical protein [Pantoea sp. Z09]
MKIALRAISPGNRARKRLPALVELPRFLLTTNRNRVGIPQ